MCVMTIISYMIRILSTKIHSQFFCLRHNVYVVIIKNPPDDTKKTNN